MEIEVNSGSTYLSEFLWKGMPTHSLWLISHNWRMCSFFSKSPFKAQILPLSSQPPMYLSYRSVHFHLKDDLNAEQTPVQNQSYYFSNQTYFLIPYISIASPIHSEAQYINLIIIFNFPLFLLLTSTCHVQPILDQKRSINYELAYILRVAELKKRTKGLLVTWSHPNSPMQCSQL